MESQEDLERLRLKPITFIIAASYLDFQRWRERFVAEQKVLRVDDNDTRVITVDRQYKYIHSEWQLRGWPANSHFLILNGSWDKAPLNVIECRDRALKLFTVDASLSPF